MDEPIVVFITGCSSGFGRATAEILAKKGMHVFAGVRETSGRNAAAASDLRKVGSEGCFLRVIDLDVCSDSSVAAAVRQTLDEAEHIDVLVNNAGFAMVGAMEAFTLEQWQKLFNTNFFGAVRMDRAVLPSMRHRRSGLLIHISSMAGRAVVPGQGIYGAAKHALAAFAEAYRYELAPFGIDSILIEPFIYSTGIFGKIVGPEDESRAAEYVSAANNIEGRQSGFLQAVLKSPEVGNPTELGEKVAELINTH